MPLDPDFVADCPYAPEGLFIEDVLEIDTDASRVVCLMPTFPDLPLTRHQRADPVRHPRHVNAGLMVHVTGIVAFVHAFHVLGLRHAQGWAGYGTRIRKARFRTIARIGPPLAIEATAIQVKRTRKNVLARYEFVMRQEDRLVYEGDQTAMFVRLADGDR